MLTFTPLTWSDAGPLYVWRHDPETVKWSLSPPPTWEEHLVWMNKVISRQEGWIWMGRMFPVFPHIPVVCVSAQEGEVSVTVNPYYRGKGIGTKAIEHLQTFKELLEATIKKGNEASIRLFSKCGFCETARHNDLILMEWTP